MESSENAPAKLAAAKERFGREIRVFETLPTSATTRFVPDNDDPGDDFYEFTTEDYQRIMATKKEDHKYLKTRKIREAEAAARRAKITKAVVRVRFPDNYTLEAAFHPSETIQSLVDLLKRVIYHPEVPFYLYTTPPKMQLKDTSRDFYSAGFVPGAIVYFAYDDLSFSAAGSFLAAEVMSLQGLEIEVKQEAEPAQLHPDQPLSVTSNATCTCSVPQRKPTDKKTAKPKWLKM